MRQTSGPEKAPAEQVLKDIRRATRRQFSAEEKNRVVLECVRGEESIAEPCRREGIALCITAGRRSPGPRPGTEGVPLQRPVNAALELAIRALGEQAYAAGLDIAGRSAR